jgi:prephenate dehydratase
MKIGYQGIEGSYCEEAARKMIYELNLTEYELIPLLSAKSVVEELEKKNINLGVLAVENNFNGEFVDAKEALKNKEFNKVSELVMDIRHCLYRKEGKSVTQVASHVQALNQTRKARKQILGNYPEIEIADTALAAKMLSEGQLPDTTAVICSRQVGEKYNLVLIVENLGDRIDNKTAFHMFKV